jgi:hypothetical protein
MPPWTRSKQVHRKAGTRKGDGASHWGRAETFTRPAIQSPATVQTIAPTPLDGDALVIPILRMPTEKNGRWPNPTARSEFAELAEHFHAGKRLDLQRRGWVDARDLQRLLLAADRPALARLELENAWIAGDLDLKGCQDLPLFSIIGCFWDGALDVSFASLNSFWIESTSIEYIEGTRCRASGSIYLRHEFEARAGVNLSGAFIGGTLAVRGATLRSGYKPVEQDRRKPLMPDHAASVSPSEDPYALRLVDARIAGRLLLVNPEDSAGPTKLVGNVELRGCDVGEFCDAEENYRELWEFHDPASCDAYFKKRERDDPSKPAGGTRASPDDLKIQAKSRLLLGGFTYRRLSVEAPTDSDFRRAWLRGFRSIGDDEELPHFRTQPFTQLARSLRELGLEDVAKEILIELHRRGFQRRALALKKRIRGLRAAEKWRMSVAAFGISVKRWTWDKLHRTWDLIARFGYRPARMHVLALTFVGLTAGVVDYSHRQSAFAPAVDGVLRSSWWKGCAAQQARPLDECLASTRADSSATPDYPRLRPVAYALDVFLPIAELEQERYWIPASSRSRASALYWFLVTARLLGWVYVSISVASLFGSLTKRGEG